MDLTELRERLSAVDRELIERVAERQRIVALIGQHKREMGAATRDYRREKEVLQLARDEARMREVDPDLAETVMRALIRSSLESQERSRVAAEQRGDGRSALVIGGRGKMGGWFVEFFSSQGFTVSVTDPAIRDSTPNTYRDWHDAGTDYDVIVVATPMKIASQIMSELAALRPAGLVIEISSLKTPVKTALQRLRDAGVRVCSMHPMFGPDTRLLSGRHLIFVDIQEPVAMQQARDLFAATMATSLEMNLEDHDRVIAYVLGLSHALNIAFFTALADSGEAAPLLEKISSTTFDAQLGVAAKVAEENPYMYFEIQHLNEFGLRPLAALVESSQRILQSVRDGDQRAFVAMMENGHRYLAERG